MKKLTKEEFIERSKLKHGELYDYSLIEYKNSTSKVDIICLKHKITFQQSPSGHMSGRGCPVCRYEKSSKNKTKTNEQFLEEAFAIHGDKYDYSKATYTKGHNKITIICPIHGEFEQNACDHLSGNGCPVCARITTKEKSFKIENTIKIKRPDLLKYLKNKEDEMLCCNTRTRVDIKCPFCCNEENVRLTRFSNRTRHCKYCSDSLVMTEKVFYNILKILDIEHIHQYSPDWANNKKYDFYLPKFNTIVEIHGLQHYKEIKGWNSNPEDCAVNDNIKRSLSEENNISNYIEIDARFTYYDKLKVEYINSMQDLFEISELVFNKAWEVSQKSEFLEAVNLFNMGTDRKEISKILNKNKNTINTYLRDADRMGLCKYINSEGYRQTKLHVYKYDLDMNFIADYPSIRKASMDGAFVPELISKYAKINKPYKNFIWSFEPLHYIDEKDVVKIG